MRYVNGIFAIVLGLFALVQYNDPDFIVWFLIYAIPSVFCAIAASRPAFYRTSGALRGAFWACFALAVVGTVWYWPTVWTDWIHVEETREGVGMWMVMASMIAVALGLRAERRTEPAPA
ncbi:MAG TPA: transmembrane 220 family protein [Geminicoccaceae bacterium]